jgi:hypothetical protein
MKRCDGSKREPPVLGITSPGAMLSLFGVIQALLAWPLLAEADDIDQQLERNMRVFSHAPSQPGVSGQSLAPEPGRGTQAQMVVFDRMGRARAPQRVALGPLPPPQNSAEKPLTEYPRSPQPPKPSWELDYTATSGYREDRLNWNIAAGKSPPYGYLKPNIISELTWNNLKIAQLTGKAEITSPGGWHFQGNVNYGWITNGNNQDSDYDFNNRVMEFSRSYAQSNSGHVLDASVGAGYRFTKRDKEGKIQVGVAPLLGYSYSEQYLTMTHGVQTIAQPSPSWCDPVYNPNCTPPSLGSFYGLDSRYTTQWHGPWLGFKLNAQPLDWMEMFTQYEYHWANYYAKANWSLRPDFQHPVSFKHNAWGDGMKIGAGIRFMLTPAWAFDLNANYSTMTTDPGTSTFYNANGSVAESRLNRVQWDYWDANAGIRYRF